MGDYIIRDGELYHYGVKGMKWGIRRYHNKDGSLTPEGKKRVQEEGGWYLNPPRKTSAGKRANRDSVSKKYRDDYAKLMKKYGVDYGKMDGSEASIALRDKSGKKNLDSKLWNSYMDKYVSATLKDLKLADTVKAREYVKRFFSIDL